MEAYSREIVDAVWADAECIDGNDPELWRKDASGTWIHRLDYGRHGSEFGWTIVNQLGGLKPTHWQHANASTPAESPGDSGMMELF